MKKTELDLYINTLWDEGRRCYNDLREHELEIVASMVILKSKHQWDHIVEAKGNDTVPAKLCAYLLERSDEAKSDLLDVLVKGAVNSVEKEVDSLFESKAETEAENEREELRQYRGRYPLSEADLMVASNNAERARELNNLNRGAY